MTGFPGKDHDRLVLVEHPDLFPVDAHVHPAAVDLVLVGVFRVDLFDVQVLHVGIDFVTPQAIRSLCPMTIPGVPANVKPRT